MHIDMKDSLDQSGGLSTNAQSTTNVDGAAPLEDLISRIYSNRDVLRPSERRVAEVVLADVENAVRASNAQIAKAAGVSEPTVTRFCRAMGCEGVRDFKLRLAQSLVTNNSGGTAATQENAELPFWGTVFGHALSAIGLAQRQIDVGQTRRAIEAIAHSRNVFVFGVGGGSTALAQDMQYRLFRHGLSVAAYHDSHLMRMAAASTGPGQVVLAISATGRTQELIEAARIAHSYSATVIAVTKSGTELAKVADIVLTVDVPEIVNAMKPTASRYAFMAVLDLIATGVAYERGPEGKETWRRVKLALMQMRNGDVLEPLGD
jgi:DNA-binding MurR/RpiR family transcriptional regulator